MHNPSYLISSYLFSILSLKCQLSLGQTSVTGYALTADQASLPGLQAIWFSSTNRSYTLNEEPEINHEHHNMLSYTKNQIKK